MEVRLHKQLPTQYTRVVPTTYETQFLYTGMSRVDKTNSTLTTTRLLENGHLAITEQPYDIAVLSRVYHVEHAKVDVYSKNPKVWSEMISPTEVYFFEEVKQVQQAA